jgi:hypothetical protein
MPPAPAASVASVGQPAPDAAAPDAAAPDAAAPDAAAHLPRAHARRLREVYRSAGWPLHDAIEVELLAAGLLQRVLDPVRGAETLRLTDAGIARLAQALRGQRAAFDAHEALVERVVLEMQRAGRIAWRGLALRARVDAGWVIARPDVYSVRHTTVEDYLAPVVHEVKVRRADLLADLRLPAKRAAYLQSAAACSYVLAEGIAEPEEIPPECGVMVARRAPRGWGALECLRPAPQRALRLSFGAWMALARATPAALPLDDGQALLGDAGPGEGRESGLQPLPPVVCTALPEHAGAVPPFRPGAPAQAAWNDAPQAPGADAGAGL